MLLKSERTEALLYERPRLPLVVVPPVLAVEEEAGHAEDAAAEPMAEDIVAKVVGMAEAL